MTTRTHYQDGELIRTLRWTRADGSLMSDEELRHKESVAAEYENYEQAALIRDELARRKKTAIPPPSPE